ncbi:competence type IV pilus ATPase ComGA [Lactobacillus sp. ESL0785]|uniref:competence type IV pilus ATPase ComGA n=1 Tax=Lactobacillus sp. ESL0785 TaxID=2983232 RepID=UPI0023F65516|nr:competence type IV pilus ATPase ComGA [Lactobacillus sp. ESL0785]WEV71455.1 competence type IV pilus ATPase ComGA [Lactobacillus sp. ESL0785]
MRIKEAIAVLIEGAIELHASDLFFLLRAEQTVVKMRTIAGITDQSTFTLNEGKEIINYLKYTAQMDIAEHRRPQVGALTYEYDNDKYYLRLSSVGDFTDCESLVVRIIYQVSSGRYFLPKQITQLKELTHRRGLIITSGPTGSGKTTTMYKLAKNVGQQQMVMTIEDPVEIHEASFLQTQVNPEANISYSRLLEAALRHRPDILIIGEIRNAATAKLAVDAALSGHLVLATVHAKNTFQTISRLESLQIKRNELSNCLTAISYQRLLPTQNGFSCLMDIASGVVLQDQINSEVHSNFVAWQENLKMLVEKGEISGKIYQQYQEG